LETPCRQSTIDTVLEPFLLERRLLPKVWGGRALQDLLEMPLPAGEKIGESWELFDRPDGSSKLRGSDTTLAELVRRDPAAIVGRGVPLGHGGSFPLMLKFLDAHDGLSLQVHPDDRQARGDGGKNECCVILFAGDDARIVHGVKPGVTRDELLANLGSPAVEQMLYSFRPEVGELVHIPPGTPHGIGPGVVAFEVQQNSDLTYRFYDWGRGRDVHVDDARSVVDAVAHDERPVGRSTALADGGDLLLATDHFVLRRYDTTRRTRFVTDGGYLTITCVGGSGRLEWRNGEDTRSLELGGCDTVLVPACVAEVALEPAGRIDVMVCSPGAR